MREKVTLPTYKGPPSKFYSGRDFQLRKKKKVKSEISFHVSTY